MVSVEHKQHNISLVSETTAKAKEELKQKLEKMKDKKQTMDDCLQQAKVFYKDVIDEDKVNVELIKKTFNEVRNILAEKEEQLIAQVQAQSMLKGENLDKFSKAVHAVTQTVNYMESVVKVNFDDLVMISEMSKQIKYSKNIILMNLYRSFNVQSITRS
uniref:Uncharacterized protein n=1 Tax=Clytia hemisphaerica TaxID=252671 RepID=A0A7M5X1N0_9CNID